jgi:hypothetical protein
MGFFSSLHVNPIRAAEIYTSGGAAASGSPDRDVKALCKSSCSLFSFLVDETYAPKQRKKIAEWDKLMQQLFIRRIIAESSAGEGIAVQSFNF